MSDLISAAVDGNDWPRLVRELRRRTREPIHNAPFVFYCVLGVAIFGGLGVWAEVVKIAIAETSVGLAGLITAIITFYPALAGSTTIHLVYASVNRNDKVLLSFGLLLLCLFPISALLLSLFSGHYPIVVLVLGTMFSLGVVWVWWITYCDDATYKQMPAPDAATGGDPERSLSGDLSDFEV